MINKLFEECKDIIVNRGVDYGEAKESFDRIAAYWSKDDINKIYACRVISTMAIIYFITLDFDIFNWDPFTRFLYVCLLFAGSLAGSIVHLNNIK